MSLFTTFFTGAALLGAALMAGVFFAFSTFVMRALARVAPEQGIEAMRQINRTVINPWFLGAFMGTALIGLMLTVVSLRWEHPASIGLMVGGLLYIVGTFGVTVVFNVPMNDKLETLSANAASETDGVSREALLTYWEHYLSRWLLWNHLRTVAAALSVLSLAVTLWLT